MTSEPRPEEPGISSSDLDELEQDDSQSEDVEESSQLNHLQLSPEDAVTIGWRALAKVIAVGLGEAVAIVAMTLLLRSTIDNLISSGPRTSLFFTLIGALVAVALLRACFRGLEFSVSESIGYHYVNRLRMVMYTHLQRIPGRRLLNLSRGGILLRFTGDLVNIRTWVSRGIALGIVASISIVAGAGALFYLDPLLALLVMGTLMVAVGLSLQGGTVLRSATRAVRRQRANLTTNLTEQIHGMATIQALGRSSGEYDRLLRQSDRLTRRLVRFAWVRGWLRTISTGSSSLAIVGVLGIGAYYFDSGRITIGTVVAAILVARTMFRPVRILGISNEYRQSARVSREKILIFLRQQYREAKGQELEKLRVRQGLIEFRNVSLAGALNNINAHAEPRQIVAIMGPNGAGKTSLLSMVSRLSDPDTGEVLVDRQILANCSLRSCGAQISMMSNALPLLRGTLRRNLLYRWRDAPESELERVIELCGLREVIAHFPEGLSANIKEGGANLSAGHSARVAMARAMVGNPKILLLDEPTLNLDDASKRVFREVLLRYSGTVLMVSHDPEDAAIADIIWQMEKGRIVATIPGYTFRESIAKSVSLPEWARAGGRR